MMNPIRLPCKAPAATGMLSGDRRPWFGGERPAAGSRHQAPGRVVLSAWLHQRISSSDVCATPADISCAGLIAVTCVASGFTTPE